MFLVIYYKTRNNFTPKNNLRDIICLITKHQLDISQYKSAETRHTEQDSYTEILNLTTITYKFLVMKKLNTNMLGYIIIRHIIIRLKLSAKLIHLIVLKSLGVLQ